MLENSLLTGFDPVLWGHMEQGVPPFIRLLFSSHGTRRRQWHSNNSCLENLMGRVAWKAAVHGVAEGRTRLSNFTITFHCHALEKEMATHSSVLAWRIPGTEEPVGLPSMGSHRVGHDGSDLAAAAAAVAFCFP